MKRFVSLLLAAVMCLSLAACGGKETAAPEVTAPEITAPEITAPEITAPADGHDAIGDEKTFLIEQLGGYIDSDAYIARKNAWGAMFGPARKFTVTRVIEISADGLGMNNLSVHFLAVKADCDWAVDGCGYSDILLVADYNTGVLYDEFMADDSWQNRDGSMEQQIWYMLHCCLVGAGYDGGTIIVDSEKRTELSQDEIAQINQALWGKNDSGPKKYTVLAEPEYPELFTGRVLDDAAIAALKDADFATLQKEISTPADFVAWLDTQQAPYYSGVTSNEEGQLKFGPRNTSTWYKQIFCTPYAAVLAAYFLRDDIPDIGVVAVNMDYLGGVMLCGNVIPTDEGCYVISLDYLSEHWQQGKEMIMSEVFPLIQITELEDLVGFCGSADDISCYRGTVRQAFYLPTDEEVVLEHSYGWYTPQYEKYVQTFYQNPDYVVDGREPGKAHIKPENIGQYQLSKLLGGATLTAEEAYKLLDMKPEQVKERVKTAADVLMYMLAANIGDCGGCYCDEIDGQIWHSNLSAFGVMEQRLSNCGASANLANYLLEGDYEEVGFILHGYYIGQGGGHVYNYIRHEGKYYIVDFSWYIFNGYRPENDFPVMVLDRLEDFGPRCAELYGPVSMVIAHTSTGQHLPNVFDDANRIYAVPKGAEYTILYQDNSPDAYQVGEYPLDQSKLDWTVFRSEISERPSRNYGKVTAAFDIKPENIGQYRLSDLLGGTTLTAEEAYDLLDMEPEQVRERVKTAADVLMYMLAGKMGDNGGCYCDLVDGQIWHSNFTAFKVMEQRLGNCGSFANLANYLLEGDYEEVGFILHGYYIGQGGGHVYNYIRHEGKYYIVDFSWYMFNGYRPENDFPVIVLDRLKDYGPRCAELYGPVSMVIAHTSTGQHLPNVFDDANRIYAVPKGAEYTILYQDRDANAYQVGEYPLDQSKLDWTKFE